MSSFILSESMYFFEKKTNNNCVWNTDFVITFRHFLYKNFQELDFKYELAFLQFDLTLIGF